MKKTHQKENRILKIAITIATITAITLACALVALVVEGQQGYGEETKRGKQENRIVIEVPEESTKGTIRVFDYDGCCIYAYYGEIEIRNDGKNGEEIDIICAGYLEAYEQHDDGEREGDK